MSASVRSIARRLPDGIADNLRSTPLHRLYHGILIRTLDTVEIDVTCGDQSTPIQVAEDSKYTGEGEYEPVLSSTLCDHLNSSSVYYDVGSQYGYFLALAQAAGVPDENLYGFDINPYALHVLSKNFSETSVTVTDAMVSDTSGDGAVTLNDFAAEYQSPTTVKMDVEGAELAVLNGMHSILETDRPDVMMEVHPRKLADRGHAEAEPIRVLEEADYAVRTCDHRDEASVWKDVSDVTRSSDATYLIWARPEETA